MKNCDCLTVKKYDGEYHCMQCYALFIPAPVESLAGQLAEDYKIVTDTWYPSEPYPDEPGFDNET